MKAALRNSIAAFSLASLGLTAAARATIIASENFGSDSPGTLTTSPNGGGGTGWSGNWATIATSISATIATGALSTPSGTAVTPSGNTAYFNDSSGSAENSRTFTTAITASVLTSTYGSANDTLYFSYLVVPTTTSNYALFFVTGSGTTNSVSNPNGNLFSVGQINNSSRDWVITGPGGGQGALGTSTTVASTTPSFVTGSFSLSTGLLDVYVNPQGTAVPASPTVSYTFTPSGTPTVTGIIPYAANSSTEFGNIVFGSTYADVVPEPTALAIVSLPTVGLLAVAANGSHDSRAIGCAIHTIVKS